MRIYHYTNIETLALILKNCTIRFNRLDKVDDIEEGNIKSNGINLSFYTFVSCWTKSSEENIPLWKLYGGDKNGIRISMDHQMFNEEFFLNKLKVFAVLYQFFNGNIYEDISKESFFIYPFLNSNNDIFFRDVIYVDDPLSFTDYLISDFADIFCFKLNPIGTYKHKRWEFQQESRYVLNCVPINLLQGLTNKNLNTEIITSYKNNKLPEKEFIDMPLKKTAFDSLEITLHPSATETQKIIVNALLQQYAPKANLKKSNLAVRLK